MDPASSDSTVRSLFQSHSRNFEQNQYVYPVLSRRAGGISIGVNLNIDQICNFNCVYCQVDRSVKKVKHHVDTPQLIHELRVMVELLLSSQLFAHPRFCDTPQALRRLNDIAISGDGEPTLCGNFAQVVSACAEIRRDFGLHDLKLVLITNATLFHHAQVQQGLELLDAHHGEIWAKLDAGSKAYYRQVDRSAVSFEQVLCNLREAARVRPIVIQSLFMRIHGEPPTSEEQEAFCGRLNDLRTAGGQIKLVQIHTVARPPAESWVTPLTNIELDALADLVRHRTGLSVTAYH